MERVAEVCLRPRERVGVGADERRLDDLVEVDLVERPVADRRQRRVVVVEAEGAQVFGVPVAALAEELVG